MRAILILMYRQGFTVIEILVVIVLFTVAGFFLVIQRNNLADSYDDDQRKTAINAMYYSLEEVFYKEHGYYPTTISQDNLPSVDPSLFTDPNGKLIDTNGSDYHYKASGCEENKCQHYTLRAKLAREADFVKASRNHK